jgi:hypothetical protein
MGEAMLAHHVRCNLGRGQHPAGSLRKALKWFHQRDEMFRASEPMKRFTTSVILVRRRQLREQY